MSPARSSAADDAPPLTGRFARLGAFCVRRRWWILIAWAIALVGVGMFAPRLAGALKPGGFEISNSQSERSRIMIGERFGGESPAGVSAVMTAAHGGAAGRSDLRAAAARVAAVAARFPALVHEVEPILMAPDGRVGVVTIGLREGIDQSLPRLPPLLDDLAALSRPDVAVGVTGGGAIFRDFDRVNARDLRRSEMIQIPLVLLILLAVLGTVVAAAIPITATGIALAVTMGLLFFGTHLMDMSIYVRNIVALVGIGVGVDYSLFLVKRFREQLDSGDDTPRAVITTMATAGRAVFFSGLTVVVALAGLLAVRLPIFTAFAVGSMTVVAIAVLCALTLIPALLATLGDRVRRLDVLRVIGRRRAAPRDPAATPIGRWATLVMRRPWVFLTAGTLVLIGLALPALRLDLGSSGSSALPDEMPSVKAARVIADLGGAGAVAPIRVVLDRLGGPVSDDTVARVRTTAAADDETLATTTPRRSDDGRATLFEVIARHHEDDPRAQALAGRLRVALPAVLDADGSEVIVGGAPAQNLDFNETVATSLPRVIALVMLLTFLVLVVLFRSLLLPLKAVVMTLLSVLATYGVLVMVFQWGWAAGLLGIDAPGHVTAWVPPFLFSIMFGLSMDYEVFLLTRVREGLAVTGADRPAVAWGLARSGTIITAAAAIMIVVFLSFLTNRLVPIKETALGLAVAIFLDATIVRMVLAPAFMMVAGRWNWWLPAWLDRRLASDHLR